MLRPRNSRLTAVCVVIAVAAAGSVFAASPPLDDYCGRLQHQVQDRKHGFLAGNVTYYVGGFHASWQLKEHETLGLTHPFHHDLRSRGVGLVASLGQGADNTGVGNDFSGWEFYKDTRVLYGSVVIGQQTYRHPVPTAMYWRPDRMICEYDVAGVRLTEHKFIAANDAACSLITSSQPVRLRFEGHSFLGRHSIRSTAAVEYSAAQNAIRITEGGTTRSLPDTDRSERTGPIMYQDMSTVLTCSHDIKDSCLFRQGPRGEWFYEFEVTCGESGVALVWAMHDDRDAALRKATDVLGSENSPDPERSVEHARRLMDAKTLSMNRMLNEQVPRFRCSDSRFEDVYYYLWSLYLMYMIDVGEGFEQEPHTQTAVNNFLGIHRYDAAFQMRVGAWTADKARYAYGSVLTWKHLYQHGHYRKSADGTIALADNKGIAWHSGIYGNELSEHVQGAWQIYRQSGDAGFLRDCYDGYFREVFRDGIAPFFSNHFEVAETLAAMAVVTGNASDEARWRQMVPQDPQKIRSWFDRRWEMNGHPDFFAGPQDGMLMTTAFWHMRSRHFPREYARRMTDAWALDSRDGFFGDFFPLAMARRSMRVFDSGADNDFGYTPDTAWYTLSGMFRSGLRNTASALTVNHIGHYNYHPEWKIPVAPEAYRRDGTLFGDQYSNFNAGKLLLILEGLAGLEYSVPERQLIVRDAMPSDWDRMEVSFPVRFPDSDRIHRPVVRYTREVQGDSVIRKVRVSDCPLRIVIRPSDEGHRIVHSESDPAVSPVITSGGDASAVVFEFGESVSDAEVRVSIRETPGRGRGVIGTKP